MTARDKAAPLSIQLNHGGSRLDTGGEGVCRPDEILNANATKLVTMISIAPATEYQWSESHSGNITTSEKS